MTKERLRLVACTPDQPNIYGVFQQENCLGVSSRSTPCEEICTHLASIGCRAIVIQDPVLDPDFFAEYLAYYAKAFSDISKYCKRFHFFSIEPHPGEHVLDYIDRAAGSSNSYLGLVTIRPVKSSPIAASILAIPPTGCFVLCKDSFDVHIAGQEFSVVGTPFIQQDNAVGACAQASIWMALRTLRRKAGFSALDPAEITTAATKFLVSGRTLPNRTGLSIPQMIEAIRFAGYSTHYLHIKEPGPSPTSADLAPTKEMIYTYIESGIPVLLGLFPNGGEGHAVATIGHGWDNAAVPRATVRVVANTATIDLIHASSWINHFFINNDNTGPYRALRDSSATDYCLSHVRFVIPLLPNDVFITGEEASETAMIVLQDFLDQLPLSPSELASASGRLVVRTFLSDRHSFRKWALNSNLAQELQNYFRLKTLPKRVWVTEICLLDPYSNEHSHSNIRVGEIILDPTGDPSDPPFLSVHLSTAALFGLPHGLIWDRDQNGEMQVIPVADDNPYDRFHRA